MSGGLGKLMTDGENHVVLHRRGYLYTVWSFFIGRLGSFRFIQVMCILARLSPWDCLLSIWAL